MMPASPLAVLLLQITVILVIAKLTAAIDARAGQPAVVGEMLGGILLGPSFFGWLWPSVHRAVIPADTTATLQLLSQIGVILFMFTVGLDLDPAHLRQRAPTAIAVSHFSIVIPYKQRLDNIRLCFESLAEQTLDSSQFEVLVGAMEYSPEYVALCREFTGRLTIVSVLSDAPWQITHARNLAMRQASGQVMVQLDRR